MEPQVKPKSAPGKPGAEPLWTSSAKCCVGTALEAVSRVWFTVGQGIVNETYWPEIDQACVRDMELIVTDGDQFFSEEKCDTSHRIEFICDSVPAYRIVNENKHYRIEREIITDPRLDVLLQRIRFIELRGKQSLHLYVLLAPHLGNKGAGNSAWIESIAGQKILFASRDRRSLALACSAPFLKCSAGFVGVSDGWQDLHRHKQLTWDYSCAENGNVALVAELDRAAGNDEFVLALGFGSDPLAAAHHARASLLDGFDPACAEYISAWRKWQNELRPSGIDTDSSRLYSLSATVLRIHQAKKFPGGSVASLSIPWGFARGDKQRGAYHFAWPRDLVEIAGGLLAVGKQDEAGRVLRFLAVCQKEDGSWPQNLWVNGRAHWHGLQMDEMALPALLAARAVHEEWVTGARELKWIRSMVRKALRFIVSNGPATEQDRWENAGGYSPYTLALEIAALMEGADIIEKENSPGAAFLRETARSWNESIERWCYVRETALCGRFGVDGYYVRITPQGNDGPSTSTPLSATGSAGGSKLPASDIVSPDALALVRYGLRAPDDPRILNTVRVIDALLKIDTPCGPCWHRYNGDTYGEHADGAPFDGSGIGRAWPLLTGERAHYEIAAGNIDAARHLLGTMAAFAGKGRLIPEQIWDTADVPNRNLFFGKPSGSAMPLAWAHAEYVKLCRSLADGRVYDTPVLTSQCFAADKSESRFSAWRFTDRIQSLAPGKDLRIEASEPARIHWTIDNWSSTRITDTRDSNFGIQFADLPSGELPADRELSFRFQWLNSGETEGASYSVSR